jgi:preprotein translocase subunit SecA
MTLLERLWDFLGVLFGDLGTGFAKVMTGVFGSANARFIKSLQPRVDAINALESKYEAMSDDEMREETALFKQRLDQGETVDDLLVEAFALCREAGKRYLKMRHYDVQMMGGVVLFNGAIAEMVTGEGKTLVATLPAYLNALEGKGVHVVTVNDYLARRDMEWMGPLYSRLGLTVGAIQNDMTVDQRQKAYDCDITYGTNNEFGFDYLRDNMRPAARGDSRYPRHMQQSQGPLHYAIIDEVDNILIDEARTPLIISGPAHDNVRKYADADRISRQLKSGLHFEVNEKDHNAHLTDAGVREAERLAGVESFYTAGNMEWPRLIDNSLKAHHIYKCDVNYVVKDGAIVIVDEFTGRLMEGRQWSDGLHQAVEAKENVKIKEETQTLATITLQNFFKLYSKLAGMTGTAMTEADEFWKIYKLDVYAIPTNRPMQRIEFPDLIYSKEPEKYKALANDIERTHRWDVLVKKDGSEEWGEIKGEQNGQIQFKSQEGGSTRSVPSSDYVRMDRKGRPILVGTTSIEKSELLSSLLGKRGIKHEVLNAKQHKREAEIVAQAGRKGAVTIATNMAGRGTDIVLGGNPETLAWAQLQDKYETRLDVPREEWDALVDKIEQENSMKEQGEQVKQLGGLLVVGTERHEARRIDLQLRGRTGRQGDPGSSRFYLSLQDDLMRIFAGPWVEKVLTTMGLPDDEAIESRMVTRRLEAAQQKVEERNFEIRKNLLEYDEVMDEQRKRVYSYRQRVLEGVNCKTLILEMIDQQVEQNVSEFMRLDYNMDVFASWVGPRLSTSFEGRDFRDMTYKQATEFALDSAERRTEIQVLDAIDENLPKEEDPSEWNWVALAGLVNTRWNLNLRDRDLKKIGRDVIDEHLIELAQTAIRKIDVSDGSPLLESDFGLRQTVEWARAKFGVEIDIEAIRDKELADAIAVVQQAAFDAYEDKEAGYPIMAAMYRFSNKVAGGHSKIDRQALVNWAGERFGADISIDDIRNKQREDITALLIQHSRNSQKIANQKSREAADLVAQTFGEAPVDKTALEAGLEESAMRPLADWAKEQCAGDLDPHELARVSHEIVARRLESAVEDKYRPEMRRMERALMLELVDTAWKEHLLVMDHLRSSVGLVGYAQIDPKVEYKREGMRLFEQMWRSTNERVTDYLFKMEQLDERFVGQHWVETSAVHEASPATSEIAQQQQEAIDATQGGNQKSEPIRHRGGRVGRNSPCPCGSGKKYKNCCMRSQATA